MDLKELMRIVRLNSLFKDLSDEEIMDLVRGITGNIKSYPRGKIMYFPGEVCTTFDVLLDGRVLIQSMDANGSVFTISEFGSGDTLGGNLLFADTGIYPMAVSAKTQCTILHIGKGSVLYMCMDNQNFLREFIRSISNKTLIIGSKLNSVVLKTIRQCIIEFLNFEYCSQKSRIIKLNMTKKEWAERLGIQRPSLSRELNKMRKDGILEYNKDTIIIKDMGIVEYE